MASTCANNTNIKNLQMVHENGKQHFEANVGEKAYMLKVHIKSCVEVVQLQFAHMHFYKVNNNNTIILAPPLLKMK
jgi:capsid portal protein